MLHISVIVLFYFIFKSLIKILALGLMVQKYVLNEQMFVFLQQLWWLDANSFITMLMLYLRGGSVCQIKPTPAATAVTVEQHLHPEKEKY